MEKWGEFFPGAENLDELLEQMHQQAGAMQSLLDEHVAASSAASSRT